MKGKWKVTANPIGEKVCYGIYRLLDTAEIDHSGNRELYGNYLESRAEAEKIADDLNRREI